MEEITIRDFNNRIIGYIQTQQNGDAKIYDFYRRLLGTYNKALDITKDFYGRPIAKGNQLSMLLNREK